MGSVRTPEHSLPLSISVQARTPASNHRASHRVPHGLKAVLPLPLHMKCRHPPGRRDEEMTTILPQDTGARFLGPHSPRGPLSGEGVWEGEGHQRRAGPGLQACGGWH